MPDEEQCDQWVNSVCDGSEWKNVHPGCEFCIACFHVIGVPECRTTETQVLEGDNYKICCHPKSKTLEPDYGPDTK